MKSIFHGGKALTRLSLFAALGLAIFWGVFTYLSAHGHEIGASNMELREHIELDAKAPFVYKTYTGPQNAQELMKALDADYNQSLAKTSVSISGKFTAKTTRAGEVTGTKTTIYSSDLTLSKIDARYPRAEWLQLLLDKGITIEDSLEYASLLSKRYTLALLEDNPDLQQSGFLDLPSTDDWETYKAAYIDKLVHDHTKIHGAAEQIELGKKAVERAKAQIEQSKEQAKRAIARSKVQLERVKVQLEHAKKELTTQQFEQVQKQLEHVKEQLERAKKQIEHVQETLEYPKEPTPPQELTPPKEPTPPREPN